MTDPFDAPVESQSKGPPPSSDGTHDPNGQLAGTLGVLSLIMAMLGPCMCYVPYIIALVLGAMAFTTGRKVLDAGPQGETKAYATVGMYAGAVAAGWSALVMLLILAYILIYVLFFVVLLGVGANF